MLRFRVRFRVSLGSGLGLGLGLEVRIRARVWFPLSIQWSSAGRKICFTLFLGSTSNIM